MVVSNFKTGLIKKELLNQDIENILVEVYEHNVKSVDGSTVYPDFFRERKQRYEIIKEKLLSKLESPKICYPNGSRAPGY